MDKEQPNLVDAVRAIRARVGGPMERLTAARNVCTQLREASGDLLTGADVTPAQGAAALDAITGATRALKAAENAFARAAAALIQEAGETPPHGRRARPETPGERLERLIKSEPRRIRLKDIN